MSYNELALGPCPTCGEYHERTRWGTCSKQRKEIPMHDAFGRELKPGDVVIVPCIVLQIQATVDYCNAHLECAAQMPPDMTKTVIQGINTQQVLRANLGDDIGFQVIHDGNMTKLGQPKG